MNRSADTSPFVRRLELYRDLTPNERRYAAESVAGRLRRYRPKHDILAEGDKPEVVNIVLSGWAYRYKALEDGRRQVMAFLLPGDPCDLHMYLLQTMDHSVATLTDVTVAELHRPLMEQMLSRYPRVAEALRWDMLVNAAVLREWIVNIGQRTAFERICHLLCELFHRLQSVGLTRGNTFDFPLTQTELADTTGLSAVHVNRTLQELRAANLIVLEDHTVTILNVDDLMAAALFNPNYLHLRGK